MVPALNGGSERVGTTLGLRDERRGSAQIMAASRKADTAAAREALALCAREALRDAHAAAQAAFAAYATTARRHADGHLAEPFGFGRVIGYKLQPTLRNILKETNELRPGHRGGWIVSNFQTHALENGIKALDVTCEAACKVLHERLSRYGHFFAETFLD